MSAGLVATRPPGDKSISHRALMIAALAPGESRIRGLSPGLDVRSTLTALRALGAVVTRDTDAELRLTPPRSWRHGLELDCGNSGTTVRLLTGLLAGLGLEARLDGDESLRERPMDRIVYPLQAMGARIEYEIRHDRLPVHLRPRSSGELRVLRYRARAASAQVKSSLVLAALAARVEFEMWEPRRTRDHTERMLAASGVPITHGPDGAGSHLTLPAGAIDELRPLDIDVPGDPSSAMFLIGAGLAAERTVEVTGVLLSDVRTRYLEVLERFGAEVEITVERRSAGEEVGCLVVRPGGLRGVDVSGDDVVALIDEIPALAVLGARAAGQTVIRGAAELRVKESDRIAAVVQGLLALGYTAFEYPDGLSVEGNPGHVPRGRIETRGDHRVAMAFAMLRAIDGAEIEFDDPACADVSYPGFWADLESVIR